VRKPDRHAEERRVGVCNEKEADVDQTMKILEWSEAVAAAHEDFGRDRGQTRAS